MMRAFIVLLCVGAGSAFHANMASSRRAATRLRCSGDAAPAAPSSEMTKLEEKDDRYQVWKGKTVREEEGVGEVAYYACDVNVPAKTVNGLKNNLERQWSKEMEIPGFKKGQIPPFMKPEVMRFVCHTAVQDAMMEAMALYDLEPAYKEGDEMYEYVAVDGMEKEEDWMPKLAEGWRPKQDLAFRLELMAQPKGAED